MAHFKTITLLQLLVIDCAATEQDLVVVVNINNPTTKMTKSQVIDLFMGRYIAFPNGEKATPIDLIDDNHLKRIFYQNLVGMSLARVNAYWSRVKFTGRVKPSVKVPSEAGLIQHMHLSPLSIGYMERRNLTKQLKVVYAINE